MSRWRECNDGVQRRAINVSLLLSADEIRELTRIAKARREPLRVYLRQFCVSCLETEVYNADEAIEDARRQLTATQEPK